MNFTFQQITLKDLNTVLSLFKEAAEKIHKMKVDHWQYWKNPPKEKVICCLLYTSDAADD